jgi:hypothetical protein
MAKVQIRNEVVFRAPTRVGLLADVTEALNDAGVNILAIGAYDKGDNGEFLMITSNNKLAYEALTPLGGEMDMQSVLVVELPNVPGELAYIAGILAEHRINVSQIFGSSIDGDEKMLIVLTAACEADVIKLLEGV